jgi:serine/threonine protein kinase
MLEDHLVVDFAQRYDVKARQHGEKASTQNWYQKKVAEYETRAKSLLEPLDPLQQRFVYPEDMCKPASYDPTEDDMTGCPIDFSDRENARVLIMAEGGTAISKLQLLHRDYPSFFNSLLTIFDGLQILHNNSIAHNDVKPDNIVTQKRDDGTFRTRFIDFGLMVNGEDLITRAANPSDNMYQYNILKSNYSYWPFDMRLTDPELLDVMTRIDESIGETLDAYYQKIESELYDKFFPYHILTSQKLTVEDISRVAKGLKSIKDVSIRQTFILTQSDIVGLGITLAEIYALLSGHVDHGDAVTHIVLIDGIKHPDGPIFVEPEYAVHDYNDADRVWHKEVCDNISTPLYSLVRQMITGDPFERITLSEARGKFVELLPQMEKYFKYDSIKRHIKHGTAATIFSHMPSNVRNKFNEMIRPSPERKIWTSNSRFYPRLTRRPGQRGGRRHTRRMRTPTK